MIRKNRVEYAAYIEEGLEATGNLKYQGVIPPSSITRAVSWSPDSNPIIRELITESVPSILTRSSITTQSYAITRWLLGDKITANDVLGNSGTSALVGVAQYGVNPAVPREAISRKAEVEEALLNRVVKVLR